MSIVIHISDDTHRYRGHERIEEGTAARLAFVRDYLSWSADASLGPDIGVHDRVVAVEGWLMLVAV